jgi:hypothetical protein
LGAVRTYRYAVLYLDNSLKNIAYYVFKAVVIVFCHTKIR